MMDEKSTGTNEEGTNDIEDVAVVEQVPVEEKEPTILVKPPNAPPIRSLQRGAPSRDLPGLVLHVFKIQDHGKVVKCDDVFAGLHEALAANASSSFYDENKEENMHGPVYWVDVDADERDRGELYEWIDKLNLGNMIADQIKKPLEGTNACSWSFNNLPSSNLWMVRHVPRMGIQCGKYSLENSNDY